jgi:hypothetical protein
MYLVEKIIALQADFGTSFPMVQEKRKRRFETGQKPDLTLIHHREPLGKSREK